MRPALNALVVRHLERGASFGRVYSATIEQQHVAIKKFQYTTKKQRDAWGQELYVLRYELIFFSILIYVTFQ